MPKPTQKETNSLGKRVKRYASVSTAMAGFGARAAGKYYLGIDTDRQKQAERLRAALGGLKGPLMKVAQILSTIPDAVPKEYAMELAHLQADAPSMGWPFVRRRMATELGHEWEKKFKSFEHEACAAASLGQVHKAIGEDGRNLACKLQYPDMASTVEADLRQLKLVLAVFERYDRAVSTKKVQAEIADRLHEELDYERESKHIALYRTMLAEVEGVHVPEVVDHLSTGRLLTMTWLEGQRLDQGLTKRSLKYRNAVAANMFRAWYTPFYYYGVIHGDPHLGNYTVRRDHSINLLDYGCIRVFKPELVHGVINLYNALRDNDHDLAVEAYRAWGFSQPSKALIEVLNIWARFIYAPLLEDKTRLIEETNTGLYGREIANKVHEELRKIGGGIEVPREFVFMDRAAIGLGSVFLRLKAEMNWYRIFQDLIRGFDVDALAKRQAKALKSCGLPGQDSYNSSA
ncbi:MAG: AarF/ABC1/UbiB kinase family protein [Pseudomonadota bacterium]|nr:AarF/ABC1/UbiB kinase family protein [Pseudomonadota bacterium]